MTSYKPTKIFLKIGFLMFSGDMEKYQWHKNGLNIVNPFLYGRFSTSLCKTI